MAINQAVIDQIRLQADILIQAQEAGLNLKAISRNKFQTHCCFHIGDNTPSLTFFTDTNKYHCFGCGKNGDVIDFVMEQTGKKFTEVVFDLAKSIGIEINANKIAKFNNDSSILTDVTSWAAEKLVCDDEVMSYLVQTRGLYVETIQKHKIGVIKKDLMKDLASFLKEKYTREQIYTSGLFTKDNEFFFRNTIIFPYRQSNKTVYLTGRSFGDEKKHFKLANVPCNYMYCADLLKKDSQEIYLTEGEIDCLTLRQAGLNAVGIPGTTAFKDEWISGIWPYKQKIVWFDNDRAGIDAALKIVGKFNNARFILPTDFIGVREKEKKDINDIFLEQCNRNKEDFIKYIKEDVNRPITILDYKISEISNLSDYDSKYSDIIKEIAIESCKDMLRGEPLIVAFHKKLTEIGTGITKQGLKQAIKQAVVKLSYEEKRQVNSSNIRDVNCGISYNEKEDELIIMSNYKTYNLESDATKRIIQSVFAITSGRKKLIFNNMLAESDDGRIFITNYEPLGLRPSLDNEDERWNSEDVGRFIDESEKCDIFETFSQCKDIIEDFVEFSIEPTASNVIVLWIIGTYMYPIFQTYPYLYFSGEKNSGKSTILDVIAGLGFNASRSSVLTVSSIFTLIATAGATVLFDEFKTTSQTRRSTEEQKTLDIVKDGYRKGGYVNLVHLDKDGGRTPLQFSTYSPKVFAGNENIDDALESRCLIYRMIRSNKNINSIMIDIDNLKRWQNIRNLLYRTTLTHFREIRQLYNSKMIFNEIMDLNIKNRDCDKWRPLWAIARHIDNVVPGFIDIVRPALVNYGSVVGSGESEVTERSQGILKTVKYLVDGTGGSVSFGTQDIKNNINLYLEDEDIIKSVNAWVIGKCLSSFGFKKDTVKNSQGLMKYKATTEYINNILSRYGINYNSEE